jgi:Aldehyde dehydrogenase family
MGWAAVSICYGGKAPFGHGHYVSARAFAGKPRAACHSGDAGVLACRWRRQSLQTLGLFTTSILAGLALVPRFRHRGKVRPCRTGRADRGGLQSLTRPHGSSRSQDPRRSAAAAELAARASVTKRVDLELGGNGPFIVLDDADLDHAVEAAMFGNFLHQGQICIAINRIIVDERVHDDFLDRFIARVKALKLGNPDEPDTMIGPIINESQLKRLVSPIENARSSGAREGGKWLARAVRPRIAAACLYRRDERHGAGERGSHRPHRPGHLRARRGRGAPARQRNAIQLPAISRVVRALPNGCRSEWRTSTINR